MDNDRKKRKKKEEIKEKEKEKHSGMNESSVLKVKSGWEENERLREKERYFLGFIANDKYPT